MIQTYVYRDALYPVGPLRLVASTEGIRAILWGKEDPRPLFKRTEILSPGDHEYLDQLEEQLVGFFLRPSATAFTVPLDMRGSEFQKNVWQELRKIPYGQVVSYAEIARRIGAPKAVRAVARSIALNPFSIIIPCHRVVSSHGKLTGFAGGLSAKRTLLTLEGLSGFKE